MKNAKIARIKPRSDTPHAVFETSPSSVKRGRIPATSKPSIKTSHTIHPGRASKTIPMTSDTETLTSIGLAVTETRPNNIAISTLIKMIVSELLRAAEMIDEFMTIGLLYCSGPIGCQPDQALALYAFKDKCLRSCQFFLFFRQSLTAWSGALLAYLSSGLAIMCI